MNTYDNTSSSRTDHLVIVGSSAGGIEALLVFVATLPPHFPAPIVLAQHLDPKRPSNLVPLLQKRSTLPIQVIAAHTPLQPGEIYVVPPDRSVTIHDGSVEIQDQPAQRPKPSVDVLLSSAARIYGTRLIAVILTGSGSDGAAGAIEVKQTGGTVIIQNPHTARFPAMPLALPPSIVDFQVDLERLGPLLSELLMGAGIPADGDQEEVLGRILDHVKNQVRIDFHGYRRGTLLHHIGSRMVATAVPTIQQYLNYLQATPREAEALVNRLLASPPQFFRDPDAFASLKQDILPRVIERGRDRRFTLRFWMLGCGTGEDAYSLAMLLADLLGAELPHWTIKIFATDRNEAAIRFARKGLYPENLLEGLSAEDVKRFFIHVDHGYRIATTLRQMVIFGSYDPARDAPFPHIDLLVCRNMVSPFTADFQETVLNRLTLSLFPGGYLLLDKTETIHPPRTLYERVSKDGNVYRCIDYVVPSVAHSDESHAKWTQLARRSRNQPVHTTMIQHNEQYATIPTFDVGQTGHINEVLLRILPIGIVVIDRDYHILTANRLSRHLVGLYTAPEEQDFLHGVPGIPYTDVRNAIDRAFEERSTVTLAEVELALSAGGNGRVLSLSIAPLQLHTSPPELVAISIIDMTTQTQAQRHVEAMQAEQAQLLSELSSANKRLNEVDTALQDTNEQLQATQEELQASYQELETTNEELEAANEALVTTLEESQARAEALHQQQNRAGG